MSRKNERSKNQEGGKTGYLEVWNEVNKEHWLAKNRGFGMRRKILANHPRLCIKTFPVELRAFISTSGDAGIDNMKVLSLEHLIAMQTKRPKSGRTSNASQNWAK